MAGLSEVGNDLVSLSLHLGVPPHLLADVARNPDAYYTAHSIRRRRSSQRPRVVHVVQDPLRRVHRRIALDLQPYLLAMDSHVQGFRPGGSPLLNAKRHSGGKLYVVTVDIADFFGSISIYDVRDLFISLGLGKTTAFALARVCTLRGKLPQGTRCSPAIANLVALRLDREMKAILPVDCAYSRYVDDLAFSGDSTPELRTIREAAHRVGLALREGSYRRMKFGTGQYVTGLYVESADPKVSRIFRRRFERLLYFGAKDGGLMEAWTRTFRRIPARTVLEVCSYIEGVICWVNSIDPETSTRWEALYSRVVA